MQDIIYNFRGKMYDELGFNWRWGKDDVLSIKATNLKQKSEDITNKTKVYIYFSFSI